MKVGDTMKLKNGLCTDEEGARYRALEINGKRAVIEFIRQLHILPQSVANLDELQPEETSDDDERKIGW